MTKRLGIAEALREGIAEEMQRALVRIPKAPADAGTSQRSWTPRRRRNVRHRH